MIQFYAATAIGLSIFIVVLFLYNLYTGKVDALSIRNLFLLGFLHFYCLGGYFTVSVGFWAERHVGSESAFLKLLLLTPLFLFVFLLAFSFMYKRDWFQRYLPTAPLPVSSPALLISIGALATGSLLAALVPPQNFLGLFIVQFRSGMSATAMALATYYVLASRLNPMSWLVFFGTLGVGAIASTVGGSGRRGLVAVFIAIPWIWYYFSLRYRRPSGTIIKMATIGAVSLIFITAYGTYRQKGGDGRGGVSAEVRVQQMLDILRSRDVDASHFSRIAYTDTVANTLFIIENYPDNYEFSPLFGAKWFLINPVPRVLWSGKPNALGITLKDQMGTAANLGPGIIGHGWSEASGIGVVYYAVFFGLLAGFCDRAIRRNAHNPYLLAVLIAGGGNIIGLPRGDTPLFLLQITAAVVSSGGTLYIVKLLFGTTAAAFPPLVPPMISDDHEYDLLEDEGEAHWSDHGHETDYAEDPRDSS